MTSRTAGRMLHRVTLAQDTTGSDFKGPENPMFRKQNEPILKNQNIYKVSCDPAKVKMAIILPTGQWYAPSAVIHGVAWYCMVLHCIA